MLVCCVEGGRTRVHFTLFYDGPVENGPAACRPLLNALAEVVDERLTCSVKPDVCQGALQGRAASKDIAATKEWIRSGAAFRRVGHGHLVLDPPLPG